MPTDVTITVGEVEEFIIDKHFDGDEDLEELAQQFFDSTVMTIYQQSKQAEPQPDPED